MEQTDSKQTHPEVVEVQEGPEPAHYPARGDALDPADHRAAHRHEHLRPVPRRADALRTGRPPRRAVVVTPGPAGPAKPATTQPDAAPAPAPAAKAPTVVVVLDGVNFRESPSNGSTVISALKQGATLTWLATEGRWYKARDPQGRMGYISANPTLTQKR